MTEWRWCCTACSASGAADHADHALALIRMHEAFACPAFATDRDEYDLRVSRRADLSRRYPSYAPPWEGSFRGDGVE